MCALLGDFDSFRSFVGGVWINYFVEDGMVEYWDYIPSNKTAQDLLPAVYYGLRYDRHTYKLNHTESGVTPA